MMPTGNDASETFGLKYMEALGRLGIKLKMQSFEWATFLENMLNREFDCINLAWVPPLESDPEQLWHSRWDKKQTSNNAGVNDPEVDRLIDAIQIELDAEKRAELMKALHRRIYDMQPYFFMFNTPRKFAMNKNVRGFQGFKIAPGYSLRRWYYPAGTEGTRATAK
jgi:ABC-type transport system substrate-binding protein